MIENCIIEKLSWAAAQQQVTQNEAGFYTAGSLSKLKLIPLLNHSIYYGDGVKGDKGGISVLRLRGTDLLFKFTAKGMDYGHLDQLSSSLKSFPETVHKRL